MRVDRARGTVRDHPFNVAVGGDHLEKLHFKRDFLEFDGDAAFELRVGPSQILEMNIALLFAETDQAILFQRSDKKFSKPMNIFNIL